MRRFLSGLFLAVVALAIALGGVLVTDRGRGFVVRLLMRSVRQSFLLPVAVETVELQPGGLALLLTGVTVGPPGAPKVSVARVRAVVDPWRSLRRGALVCNAWFSGVEFQLSPDDRLFKPSRGGWLPVALGRMQVRFEHSKISTRQGETQIRLFSGMARLDGYSGSVRVGIERGWIASRDWSKSFAARMAGRLSAGSLEITHSRLVMPGLRLVVAGTANLKKWTLDAQARVGIDVEESGLIGLLPVAQAKGLVGLSGRLTGSISDPVFNGMGSLREAEIEGVGLEANAFDVKAAASGVRVRISSLAVGQVTGAVAVWISSKPAHSWSARGQWRGLRAPAGLQGGPLAAVRLSGRFKAGGRLAGKRVKVGGQANLRASGNGTSWCLPLRFSARRERGGGTDLRISATGSKRAKVEVRLGTGGGKRLQGRVSLAVSDVAVAGPLTGHSVAGDLHFRGQLAGTAAAPLVHGRLFSRQLRVAGVALERLTGMLSVSPAGAESSAIKAGLARGRITGRGKVAFGQSQDNDFTLMLEEVPAGPLLAAVVGDSSGAADYGALQGDVRVRVQGRGSWDNLEFSAEGRVAGLRWAGEQAGDMALSARGALGEWSAQAKISGGELGQLSISARSKGGRLTGAISGSGLRLEKVGALVEKLPGLAGEAVLSGRLAGKVSAPAATVRLEVADLTLGGDESGRSELLVSASAREWSMQLELLGSRVTGSLVSRAGSIDASLDWHKLDLAFLFQQWRGFKVFSSGHLALAGEAWDLRRLSGSLRVDELAAFRYGEPQLRAAGASASLTRGRLIIHRTEVEMGGEKLSLAGRLDLRSEELEAWARGAVNLSALELVPGVVSSAGRVVIDGRVGKDSRGMWHLSGDVAVVEGALDLGDYVAASDLTATVSFHDSVVEISQARAAVGGGQVMAKGAVDLVAGASLAWEVDDVSPGVPPWLESRVTGRGTISAGGGFKDMLISGDLEVVEAIYDRHIDIAEMLSAAGANGSPAGERGRSWLDEARLDLHLAARDRIFIDNNLAKMELAADLHLVGTVGAPRIAGKLETIAGQIFLGGHSFVVSSGVLTFLGREPFDARLELFAETEVRSGDEDQHVWIQVSGTIDENRVSFGADDPNLSQNDILGLLAFGATSSRLARGEASIPLSQVLSWAPVGAGLEEDVVRALPVDRLELDSSISRATGKLEPRVTASKTLGKELSAKVSTTLGSERRQEFALEYRITPEFVLEGSWQSATKTRAGAFGADIKFRHRFMDFPTLWRHR